MRLELRDILIEPVIGDARPLVALEDVHTTRLYDVRCIGKACMAASEQIIQTGCSDIAIL
jgi:hypothetical protein